MALDELSVEAVAELRTLKQVLVDHGYLHLPVADATSDPRVRPALAYKYRSAEPPDVLARLLLLGLPVPLVDASAALAPVDVDHLFALGLLESVSPAQCRSSLRLVAFEDCVVACDFHQRHDPAVEPVYAPGHDSVWLAKAIMRRPAANALDLCTGSGLQAVVASRYASTVAAVDLNPHAVHVAKISLALNGIDRVKVCPGDLYAPVAGRDFDLVTANPPFVINHTASRMFRDGGAHGDTVLQRIFEGLPGHLRPGGLAQVVTFLHDFHDRSQLDDIRIFAEEHGMEALVLTSERHDKYQLATSQLQYGAFRFETYEADVHAYLEHLDAVGFVSYVTAVVSMRRSGRPNFKVMSGLHRPVVIDADLQARLRQFFSWPEDGTPPS